MTKTKSNFQRIMLLLTAAVVIFSALMSSYPKVDAAATYPFSIVNTMYVDSTAKYNGYGLSQDITIGNSGTIHGGYNWKTKVLKTKRGYEPVYCVEPSKGLADTDYSEVSIRYDSTTHLKLGRIFLYCFTASYNSIDKLKAEMIGNHDKMCQYLATQILVWETVCNVDLAFMCGKFYSSSVCSNVRKIYDQYKKAIAAHDKELNEKYFFSTVAEANKNIFKDDSVETKTFTDANLKNFKVDSVKNGKASISGNKLSVTPTPAKTAVVHLVQSNVNDENYRRGFLTYSDGSHQAVAVSKADPMEAYISVAGQETGNVQIVKKSSDGKVSGIKFTISNKDGSYKKSATTDKNGKLNFPDLKAGTYIVTEEMTSEMQAQYNSTKSKTVVVKAGGTAVVNFTNTLYTGHISLTKYAEDGQIEGLEFALCRYTLDSNGNEVMDNFYDTKFTDANGYVEWDNLPVRNSKGVEYYYWVAEDHIPPQYARVEFYKGEYDSLKVDDGQSEALCFSIFGEDIALTAVNIEKRSEIEIYKKDKETGQVIPKAGAEFQIYEAEGELVVLTDKDGNSVSTFVTDKTGCAKLPEPLTYGEYTCVEVKAPSGYIIDKEPVKFAVTQDGATVVVEKKNSEQKGKINVVKRGDIFKSVESGDTYTPVFEESGLSGAAFDIIAVSDIYYPNGEVRIKSGTVVDTVTTDENGEAYTKELFLGDYKAVETKAPIGYVLDNSEHLVSLTYAGQEVSVTSAVTEVYNSYQNVDVSLSKYMESAEEFDIDSSDYRQYVTFGLFANENITAADGEIIPKDGLIEEVSLSEDMKAEFHKNLPFGKYYVQELTTDEHYLLSDMRYEFEFSYQGEDIPTVKIQTEKFENELKRGSVSGLKVDADDDSPLANAEIGLFMGDETEFIADNAVMTTTSAKDGSFSFEGIPYGVYQVREIAAPTGYKLANNVFPVTIDENGKVIEIRIENEKIRGNVEVKKYDKDSDEKLSGAIFTLYKDTDADGKYNATKDVSYGVLNEKDGIYSLNSIPYGDYLLAETKAPTGYVLDTHAYPVKIRNDGETVTVSNDKSTDKFYNEKIKGTVQINKFDKDSDKKLSGAEFTVYLGDSDEVYAVMEENDGVYSLSDIPFGKYSVMETVAPDGYYLDENRYEFEISNDGQVITISNGDSKDRFEDVKITTTTTTTAVTTTTTTTTTTTDVTETTPEETTSTTHVTTTNVTTTTETEVTTTEVSTTVVSSTETSTELTTSVTEVTITVSGTVPFRESSPKTGDSSHAVAVIAAVIGLLSACGAVLTFGRRRHD